MVAGFLWRQGTGQPWYLDPNGIIQVFSTGVDSAWNNEGHAEQTGTVLLRGQEVQLCAHLTDKHKQVLWIRWASAVYSILDTTHPFKYQQQLRLTIFLCMAMMYPMKGLSCTGVVWPLTTPLATGVSGLQGTVVLGPPFGMSRGLLPRCPLAAEPLAIGVTSNQVEERDNTVGNGSGSHTIALQWTLTTSSPVGVGELTETGEPGTGISNAHRKPLTDRRTFWLSWGKF